MKNKKVQKNTEEMFDIYSQIRKPMPKPTIRHKNKKAYNKKDKTWKNKADHGETNF
jgi:hypothetical protein